MSGTRSIAIGGAGIALAVVLASCASSAGSAASGTGSASTVARSGAASSSVGSTGSAAPSARSAYSSALKVTVSEPENGSTLTVNRGADVIVELHSTYWQFGQASAPKVLVQAAPEIQGDPPNTPGGVPGSGRGTARETYHARTVGTATITATRTSCGEAMRCVAGQGLYRITVIVR